MMVEEETVALSMPSENFSASMPKTEEVCDSFPAVATVDPATAISIPTGPPLLPVDEAPNAAIDQPAEIPPEVPFCEDTAGPVMQPSTEQQPQILSQELPESITETPTGKRARPKKPKSAAKTSKSKAKKEAPDSWMDGEAMSPTGADANDEVSVLFFLF